jgi:hypothetical protein
MDCPTCRHCGNKIANRAGRGLCRKCWNDPAIKDKFAPLITKRESTVVQQLKISDIRTDGDTQARASTNDETVQEYAEAMLAGHTFPPVIVFYDGNHYWMADGFHRVAAAIKAGLEAINADIRQGNQRAAILWACGSNFDHGLRRTNDDKRKAVAWMLNDTEVSQWSGRQIAMHCAVSESLVRSMVSELAAFKTQPTSTSNVNEEFPVEEELSEEDLDAEAADIPPEWTGETEEPDLVQAPEQPVMQIRTDGRTINTTNIGRPESRFCEQCRKTGPIKGCPDCEALAAKPPPKPRDNGHGRPARPGSELYDWKHLDAAFGIVARAPDDIGRAYPDEKQSTEFHGADRLLLQLAKLFKEWKNRILGIKSRDRSKASDDA